MNIILQNPYRVLGLLCNVSERDLQKQIKIIKRYTEIGKSTTFDYDFEFFGDLSRSLDDIQQAISCLEQAHQKINYALFWFINNNAFDEIALNNIREWNNNKALEIWDKTLKDEITEKNFTSYQNISSLYLAMSLEDEQFGYEYFYKGINLKGKLLNSSFLTDFCRLVSGDGIEFNTTDIGKKFIDELIEWIEPNLNNNGLSAAEFISLFESYPQNLQRYLSDRFTEVPISNIEKKIDLSIKKRNENPRKADGYGEKLYSETKNDIDALKRILSESDIKLQMIVNKLVSEIMQCAIVYYNIHLDDGDIDPGDNALRICNLASSLEPTGQIKQQAEENTLVIKEWADSKPSREARKFVSSEINFITDELDKFQNLPDTINNVEDLIMICKPVLDDMKNILDAKERERLKIMSGIYDQDYKKSSQSQTYDIYLDLSSLVVNNAQGMIVSIVNEAQRSLNISSRTNELTSIFRDAVEATNMLDSFDMIDSTRIWYNKNKRAINENYNDLKTFYKSGTGSNDSYYSQRNKSSNSMTPFYVIIAIAIILVLIISNSKPKYSSKNNSKTNLTTNNSSKYENAIPVPVSKYKGNKLKNGSSPYNSFFGRGVYNKNHKNWILFKNGYSTDAVVCLVDYYSEKTIRNEYIQAGTNFDMTNIPNGTYYMKVYSGLDWNPNKKLQDGKIKGGFDTQISFYQSKNSNDLIRLFDDGYKYTTGEITLYEVASGNMQRQSITEDTFF